MPTIASKVRMIRRARLLKQETLAGMAGLSVQALRSIEAGRTAAPRRRTIENIARVLCVSALDLANPTLTAQQCIRRAEEQGLIYVPPPDEAQVRESEITTCIEVHAGQIIRRPDVATSRVAVELGCVLPSGCIYEDLCQDGGCRWRHGRAPQGH